MKKMTNYHKDNPATIQKMFDSIAKHYDKTNAILSFCLHKHWNKTFIKQTITPAQPEILLDLCCGTGAIAFGYLKHIPDPLKVYLLDFSEGMLQCAKDQAKKLDVVHHDLYYLQADAQTIPLLNHSVDCATIAYGIRNVKDSSRCIKDVYRVLKPGGSFGILELTQPSRPILKSLHRFYLKNILPLVGKFATSDKEAYRYLCNSIQTFVPPETLKTQMKEAGFEKIRQISCTGGIATIIVGSK